MAKWWEKYEWIKSIQTWVDGESYEALDAVIAELSEPAPTLRSEQFMKKMAQQIDAILCEHIFRGDAQTFVPERFIVFLSQDEGKSWQGKKRSFLEQELGKIILSKAQERAKNSKLLAEKIEIELRIDGTLGKDEIRVQAILDESKEQTGGIVIESSFDSEKTIAITGEDEEKTVIDITDLFSDAEKLYEVEIWLDGRRENTIPVFKYKADIGRGSASVPVDIALAQADISRIHATLEIDEKGKFLLTHKGTNATKLNGRSLPTNVPTALTPSQKIEIRGFTLKIKQQKKRSVSPQPRGRKPVQTVRPRTTSKRK